MSISGKVTIDDVNLVDNLGFNLLSVAQFCANGQIQVVFDSKGCQVVEIDSGKILLKGICENNLYKVDPCFKPEERLCFKTVADVANLWHNRFGHASLQLIDKLHRQELVCNTP